MKVLRVHNHYREPGGEDAVERAERQLCVEAGLDVVVYARYSREIDDYGPLRQATLGPRSIWAWDTRRELARLVADEQPDVVHFTNTFPLISPAAYSVCRSAGAAVVQSLHNFRPLCPAATLLREGRICEECVGGSLAPSIRHGCYRGSRAASAVLAGGLSLHRALRTFQRHVDAFVTLTPFSREKFIAGGFPAERLFVKPNFVDGDVEPRSGRGEAALFVGRLSPEKGLTTLLDAWERLVPPAPLRIVGDGPLREELEARCRSVPRVKLLGALSPHDVGHEIAAARILVVPSVWYEPFGLVAIEAFARGVPVIAAGLGGLGEIVEHERNGLHFEAGNADALAAAVDRLWRSRELQQALGDGGRKSFEAEYTPERNRQILLEIYELAVARRHVRRDS